MLLCCAALLTGCHRKAVTVPSPVVTGAPNTVTGAPQIAAENPFLSSLKISPVEFEHLPPNKTKYVALTFDAGSDDTAVRPILHELTSRHLRATFFLTGKFCEHFPASCRAIAAAGMEIGNHSYSHPYFSRKTDAEIKEQLERSEAVIVQTCGRSAKPLFRFPYGDTNPRVRREVAGSGYQAIRWSLDSLDAFGQRKSADYVANRFSKYLKAGDITLMHVSCIGSANALPRVFATIRQKGLQQVPVSEMLFLREHKSSR